MYPFDFNQSGKIPKFRSTYRPSSDNVPFVIQDLITTTFLDFNWLNDIGFNMDVAVILFFKLHKQYAYETQTLASVDEGN